MEGLRICLEKTFLQYCTLNELEEKLKHSSQHEIERMIFHYTNIKGEILKEEKELIELFPRYYDPVYDGRGSNPILHESAHQMSHGKLFCSAEQFHKQNRNGMIFLAFARAWKPLMNNYRYRDHHHNTVLQRLQIAGGFPQYKVDKFDFSNCKWSKEVMDYIRTEYPKVLDTKNVGIRYGTKWNTQPALRENLGEVSDTRLDSLISC